MSTITSRHIIENMLKNGGVYAGDPAPETIWKYTDAFTRKELYAVFWKPSYCDIHESIVVESPILLFKDGKLTTEGIQFIGEKGL